MSLWGRLFPGCRFCKAGEEHSPADCANQPIMIRAVYAKAEREIAEREAFVEQIAQRVVEKMRAAE